MAVAALRVDADVRVRAGLQKGSGHGDVTPGACHNERGMLPAVAGVDDGLGPIGPSHVLGLERQVELRLEQRAFADGGHGCLFSYI